MNDIKDTNNWNYAFKHVPLRKITSRNVSDKKLQTKVQQNVIYKKLMEFK